MPYIKKEYRALFDHNIKILAKSLCDGTDFNPGELNYVIFRLMKEIVRIKGIKYSLLNDLIGALECCKLEFTRKIIATYEDMKIKANGDVD